MAEQKHLTPAETAAHYRTTEATLKYWRYRKYGPAFIRAGKHVLYPRDEIERFDRQLATGGSRARAG